MDKVIIAPAFFYKFEQLKPFVKSHLEANVSGKILFLIEKEKADFTEAAKQYGNFDVYVTQGMEDFVKSRSQKIMAYPFFRLWSLLPESYVKEKNRLHPWGYRFLHIALKRYLIVLELFQSVLKDTQYVMLTDTRDVIFQSDPFAKIQQGLYCGLESSKIFYDHYNRIWIEKLYDNDPKKEHLLQQVASCSGVTIGDRASVKQYLEKMSEEIIRHFPRLYLKSGLDQGIHNYIIYEKNQGIDIRFCDNGNSLIGTLGASLLKEFIVEAGKVFTREGELVSVVHQYHPHPKLRQSIEEKYA